MNHSLVRATGLAILLLLPVTAFGFDDGDWQFWSDNTLSQKMGAKWNADFGLQFYFGDDMSELYYAHAQPGISYLARSWLCVAGRYRYVEAKSNDGWMHENRLIGDATFLWKLWGFSFDNRNRLAYRIIENKDDFWRYRWRLRVKAPFTWTKARIQPYASEEFFYNFEVKELRQNRIQVGVCANLTEDLKSSLYYMVTSVRNDGEWDALNVLGLDLKLQF